MNLLTSLFKQRKRQTGQAVIEINNTYSGFTGTAYQSAAFRSAVDAVGRHTAKLQAHSKDKQLEHLLNTAPNPYMTGYDLMYKTAAAYFTNNNAFILLDRASDNGSTGRANDNGKGSVLRLYPIIPQSVEFIPGTDSAVYLECHFADGRQVTLPYCDVIHLRRHFLTNDLLGESNAPLFPLLDTAQTLTQAISAGAKNGTSIRGVLKFTSLVNPTQVKAEKEQFVADYFNPANTGGIAATDQRFDFVPTNVTPYSIPQEQVEAVNRQVYDYLGVNEKIISGSYTENEFSAFYESVIEPFALQLSQEYSLKCGTDVTFTAERMEFSSAATKIKLLHEAAPLGLITVNEARHLLALPPVEDGDRRLQSLNYVSADKADAYQLDEPTPTTKDKESEVSQNEP